MHYFYDKNNNCVSSILHFSNSYYFCPIILYRCPSFILLFYVLLSSCLAFWKFSLSFIAWVELLKFCCTFLIVNIPFFFWVCSFCEMLNFTSKMQCLHSSPLNFRLSEIFLLLLTLFLLVLLYPFASLCFFFLFFRPSATLWWRLVIYSYIFIKALKTDLYFCAHEQGLSNCGCHSSIIRGWQLIHLGQTVSWVKYWFEKQKLNFLAFFKMIRKSRLGYD